MRKFWQQISDMGVFPELPFSEKSRIRISNQMSVIVSSITFLYYLYDLLFLNDTRNHNQLVIYYILTFGISLHFIPVLLLNRNRHYAFVRYLSIFIFSSILISNAFMLAKPFHSELYFFGCAAYIFIIIRKIRIVIPLYFIQAAGYFLAAYIIITNNAVNTNLNAGLAVRILIAFSFLFLVLLFLRRETSAYQKEIEIKNMQLSADRDEIQKINFTKDKIFSIISHDLRNPIGSLQAVLGLVQRDQLNEQEFKKAVSGLEKQVEQLKNSLDEMLTWSKAQLHGINPSPEVTLIKPLISEVVTVNRLAARNKKIIVTTNVPTDARAFCDPNLLKSVVTNLITNAIKFTPVGGAVSVSCKIDNGSIKINVEDTGIGIPKENMEKILNPAVHFTTRGTSNEKGTGLGLIMCREFILKDNGTFEIESEDGKGSVFTITLPIAG